MPSLSQVVSFGLSVSIANAATYQNATRTTGPITSTSKIRGPYLAAVSYTWSQWIIPTTVGTVEIVINTDTNRTFTTTKTNLEFSTNGSLSILQPPTTTNDAGTVTSTGTDLYGSNITVAYPTPIFAVATDLTWNAILPTLYQGATCCGGTTIHSGTPTHAPFPDRTGSTNTADPSGWLYKLVGDGGVDPDTVLQPANVTELWAGATIGIEYNGCPYYMCNITSTQVAGASAVESQAFLFATSTRTTSGKDSSDAAPTTESSPAKTSPSVTVDPITPGPAKTSKTSSSTTVAPISDDDPLASTRESSEDPPTTTVSALPQTTSNDAPEPTTASPTQDTESPEPVTQPSPTRASETSRQPDSSVAPSEGPSSGNTPVEPVTSQESDENAATQATTDSPATTNSADPKDSPTSTNSPATPTSTNAIDVLTSALSPSSQEASNGPLTATDSSKDSPATTAATPAPIVIGSLTATTDQSSNIVVTDQTLAPGSTITLGSGESKTTVALQTSDSQTFVVVDSSTMAPAPDAESTPLAVSSGPAPIVVGSSTISAGQSSEFVVSGQTLVPGSSITLGEGESTTVVALQTDNSQTQLIVGSSSSQIYAITVPAQEASVSPPGIALGSTTITPNSNSEFVIGSQTLRADGSTITLGATPLALQTSGSQTYFIAGTSHSLLTPVATPVSSDSPPGIALGATTITPNSNSEYVIGSQTLRADGLSITLGATPLALQTSGSETYFVAGTSSSLLSAAATPAATETPLVVAVGSLTATQNSASEYVIGSQTLRADGSTITVGSGPSATAVALQTSASQTYLVIGSSSSLIPAAASETGVAPVFTIGSSTVTPNSASEYIVGSQTLKAGGPAITVSDTVISIVDGGTEIVMGTKTETATASGGDMGGYVWSGLGGGQTTTETTTSSGETSAATTSDREPSEQTGGSSTTESEAGPSPTLSGASGLRSRWEVLVVGMLFLAWLFVAAL